MNEYVVIRKADGREVYRYSHTEPLNMVGFEFDTHEHVLAQPIVPAPSALPPKPWHLTRLAFLDRFLDSEAIGIDLASQGATVQAAAMRRYMQKVNAATFIDIDRPDTRAGVQQLEAMGLIAAGRAAQILDTPPTETERYKGVA